MNILVVDDDVELAESLKRFLASHAMTATCAGNVAAARVQLTHSSFDAVLLDVMLPDQNGFEFLPQLRRLIACPIFMLSALGAEDERVRGLDLGADDYITKPFSAKELVARLRAAGRRLQRDSEDCESIEHGDMCLYPRQHKAWISGQAVALTGAESEILLRLMQARDHMVSREVLSVEVLGRANSPMDRSLDVHVSHLRRKLGPHPDKGNRIKSLRGRGYVLTV